MAKVLPPTVMLPCRGVGLGLPRTRKLTEDGPLPLTALVSVIHASETVAFQLHPSGQLKLNWNSSPPASISLPARDSVKTQGAPSWFTVKVAGPTDTVPLRGCEEGLA